MIVFGILILIVLVAGIVVLCNFQQRANKRIFDFFVSLVGAVSVLQTKTDNIVESRRLTTILRLEPTSLKISPEEFEPKKGIIKIKMLQVFEEKADRIPDTHAFCILSHSGWDSFVDSETRKKAEKALTRLIANNDKDAARHLIEELVDKI